MAPDIRFCLVFERETLSVPAMRQVLGDALRRLGVNEDSVADILLAASEACANVVLHAGQSVRAYEVVATVMVPTRNTGPTGNTAPAGNEAACRVEVSDPGSGWWPPPRKREKLAESGRGFAVMRACVDGVTLRSAPGQGTSVVLDKRITWDAPASLVSGLAG
jgi:serine/threonine-protein kinase RsbW